MAAKESCLLNLSIDESHRTVLFRPANGPLRRRIDEIWAWDDERLESVHDYIQWLFPSKRPSDFNPDAPLLNDADVAVFRASCALPERLLKSLRKMLQFYGLQPIENKDQGVIERAKNWTERSVVWVSPANRNHLRITRILACLRTLGLST